MNEFYKEISEIYRNKILGLEGEIYDLIKQNEQLNSKIKGLEWQVYNSPGTSYELSELRTFNSELINKVDGKDLEIKRLRKEIKESGLTVDEVAFLSQISIDRIREIADED